jgi:uncharacterized delta-60 repeat protein
MSNYKSNLQIIYSWPAGQNDLDSVTSFAGRSVGYGHGLNKLYMTLSEDNKDNGPEIVTIDLQQAFLDGAIGASVEVVCFADWYPDKDGSGPATLTWIYDGKTNSQTIYPNVIDHGGGVFGTLVKIIEISFLDFIVSPYSDNIIYEFEPIFDVNTSDLSENATGYAIHRNKDVTFVLSITDRQNNVLNSPGALLENPFLRGLDIDILDISGTTKFDNYVSNSFENSFTFTEQDNIDVFGSYTPKFGIGISAVGENINVHSSRYFVYGNPSEIKEIYVADNSGLWLNNNPIQFQAYVPYETSGASIDGQAVTNNALYFSTYRDRVSGYNAEIAGSVSFAILSGESLKIDWGLGQLDTVFVQAYVPYETFGTSSDEQVVTNNALYISGYRDRVNGYNTEISGSIPFAILSGESLKIDWGLGQIDTVFIQTGLDGFSGIDTVSVINTFTGDPILTVLVDPTGLNGQAYSFVTGYTYESTGIYDVSFYYSGIGSTGDELIKTLRYEIPNDGVNEFSGIDGVSVTETFTGDPLLTLLVDPTGLNGQSYSFVTGYTYESTGIYDVGFYYSGIGSTGDELIKTLRYKIPDELQAQGKLQIGNASLDKIEFDIQFQNQALYTMTDTLEVHSSTVSGNFDINNEFVSSNVIPVLSETQNYSFYLDNKNITEGIPYWFKIAPSGTLGSGYAWEVGPYSLPPPPPTPKTNLSAESFSLTNGASQVDFDFITGSIRANVTTTIDTLPRGNKYTYEYLGQFKDYLEHRCSSKILVVDNASGYDELRTGLSFEEYSRSEYSFINYSISGDENNIYLNAQFDYTEFNDSVNAIAIQSDGKILVGGDFTSYQDIARGRFVRLNTNGSYDDTFNLGSGFNDSVNAIAIQPDGNILVGGNFTSYQDVDRGRFVRLEASGSYDNTFNLGSGFNDSVNAIAIQSDGKILVGGNFTSYQDVDRSRFARLQTNGTVDNAAFAFNSGVNAIAIQPNGQILVGGDFTNYSNTGRNRFVSLNPSLFAFNIEFYLGDGFNSSVNAIAIQPDGKILVGGNFTSYQDVDRGRFVRISAGGFYDSTFNLGTGFNDSVNAIAIQPDNKILVGGDFTSYQDTPRNRFVRLDASGFYDSTFNLGTGFNSSVDAIAIQPDLQILAGGDFTSYQGSDVSKLAKLEDGGSYNTTFNLADAVYKLYKTSI